MIDNNNLLYLSNMKIITLQASLVYNHSLYYGIDFMVGILATGSIAYHKQDNIVNLRVIQPFALLGYLICGKHCHAEQ